jgi:hypothetical protein
VSEVLRSYRSGDAETGGGKYDRQESCRVECNVCAVSGEGDLPQETNALHIPAVLYGFYSGVDMFMYVWKGNLFKEAGIALHKISVCLIDRIK